MSSRDEIEGSERLKSRSTVSSSLISAFRFDGTGSTKDRLLTALVVLAVCVALTFIAVRIPGGSVVGVAFAALVAWMSAFEVARLFSRNPVTLAYEKVSGAIHFLALSLPSLVTTYVAVRYSLTGIINYRELFVGIVISAHVLMALHVVAGRARLEDATRHGGSYAPAFLLVTVGAPQLILIASTPIGIHLLWWLVAVVALNDAAAYFVGCSIGRHKLAPALSPNKSVEGSIAGLVVGIAAGLSFGYLLLGDLMGTWQLLAVSLLVVLSAQAADLSKSYLKRIRGVKDTGAFFPGHGGVLDRFDGLIGAAPIAFVTLLLLGVL
jgi:phosphatidate cytidylyltransferase